MSKKGQTESLVRANTFEIMRSFQAQTYFTPHRAELLLWFERNAPSLREIYLGALIMIYGPPFPGRIRFVSHAVREIRNRLPKIISGIKSLPSLQYINKLDEISKAWEEEDFPSDGSLLTSLTSDEDLPSGSIPVSRKLFQKISNLVKEHIDAREKPVDAARRLFLGASQEMLDLGNNLRPVLHQWLEVTEWFMKKAHDSGRVDNDIDAEEFQSQFELFETTLGALVRGFFTTVGELDEILEEANF